ncbi:MAG TPA: hypothetical protein VIJ38_08480, partial [Acidobacteriaceae bacterium]
MPSRTSDLRITRDLALECREHRYPTPFQEIAAIDLATNPRTVRLARRSIPARNKMRLLPLLGATYFMVAGGPYGL